MLLRPITSVAQRLGFLAGWHSAPEASIKADGHRQEGPTARDRAYAHFQDDSGDPLMQYASVLFWDVLGISAMSQEPPEQALLHLRRIQAGVEAARERASTEEPNFLRCSTWFTDNVVLATPIIGPQDIEMTIGPTFVDAAYMQLHLLDVGYLARGAITFGLHYMDQSFVFGPALIEAHELEESTPWPCVAVSPLAADLSREMARRYYAEPKRSPFARELKMAEDGTVFVDQLGVWLDEEHDQRVIDYYVPRHRELILDKLKELRSGRVWEKWRWLADYHDYALRSRGQNRRRFVTGLRAEHTFAPFADSI